MQRFFDLILNQPLFNALILLTVWVPGHSIGWAIILLTLIIRLLLAPSAAHLVRQQKKLQVLQPQLKELQERLKDDREGLARETMALYKNHDIHPLGSCGPMLIQLPILLSLYHVFTQGLTTDRFDLLYKFVPHPDTINTYFAGINLAQPDRLVLPLLAGGLQFIQSWMMLAQQPKNQKKQALDPTQVMMYALPIGTILISSSLPAALPLYWIVTTLFAIVQQWWLFRTMQAPASIPTDATGGRTSIPTLIAAPDHQVERRGSVSVVVRKKGS